MRCVNSWQIDQLRFHSLGLLCDVGLNWANGMGRVRKIGYTLALIVPLSTSGCFLTDRAWWR